MAHLKKAASGHLLKGPNGHLVNSCQPPVYCEECADCANDHSSITVTVSGSACTAEQQGAAGTYTFSSFYDGGSFCLRTYTRTYSGVPYYLYIWLHPYDSPRGWEVQIQCYKNYYTWHLFASAAGGCFQHCINGQLTFNAFEVPTDGYPGTDCHAYVTAL